MNIQNAVAELFDFAFSRKSVVRGSVGGGNAGGGGMGRDGVAGPLPRS